MPFYQYEVVNLFTDEVVEELDLYGVYCTRHMNTSGQFQGTFALREDLALRNASYLEATTPGKFGLKMKRNDEYIWGGIIWSRTYSSVGTTMQIFANTWESYFDHMVFWKEHFIQQKVNQEAIFDTIVDQLQGQSAASDIGLVIPSLPTTNVKRTVLIPNYEYHFGVEAINQIVGVSLGLEYTIAPDKQIELAGEGLLGSDHSANPAMSYDYPGQISQYWMPESGASGAVKLATLGAGSGNKIVRAVSIDDAAIAAGFPEWWKVTQYSDIADLSTLQAKNVADFNTFKMPYRTPTFDMKPDENFAHFNELGSNFQVEIQDVRYPTGEQFDSRLIGWELTPESNDNAELLKLQIEGSTVA